MKKRHIAIIVLLVFVILVGIVINLSSRREDGYMAFTLHGLRVGEVYLFRISLRPQDKENLAISLELKTLPSVVIKTDHGMSIKTHGVQIDLINAGWALFCIFQPQDSSGSCISRIPSRCGYEVISPDSRKIMKVMSVTNDEIVLLVYDEGFRIVREPYQLS